MFKQALRLFVVLGSALTMLTLLLHVSAAMERVQTVSPSSVTISGPVITGTKSVFLPLIFNGSGVVVHSDLIPEQLVAGAMATNSEHRWFVDLTAGEVITVQAVATGEADLAVTILDPIGSTIYSQNNAPVGEVERVTGISVGMDGRYQIRLTDAANTDTYYAMILTRENGYDYRFVDLITYATITTTTLAAEQDHFWQFYADAGKLITILVTPASSEDLFLELYGPDGSNLSGFKDDKGSGESENLIGFHTYEDGIYSIRVGENNFQSGSYEIRLMIRVPI